MRRIRGHVPRSLAGRKPEGSISRRLEIVQRESVFRWSLAVADVVAAIVALQACVLLADERLTPLGLLALPLALVVGQVQRLYSRDELLVNKTTLDQAPQLFNCATLFALLVWLLAPAVHRGHAPPARDPRALGHGAAGGDPRAQVGALDRWQDHRARALPVRRQRRVI